MSLLNGFRVKDVEINAGRLMYGRVMQYSPIDGFGFVYSENGRDIFFSSYNVMSKAVEKNICVGATVRYLPIVSGDKAVATQLEIIDKFPSGERLLLPNGKVIPIRLVRKFGIIGGNVAIKTAGITRHEIKDHNYNVSDCKYLYFSTAHGEYRFFNEGSFIRGDGQCNVDVVFDEYKKGLLYI